MSGRAWEDFCDRLKSLGSEVMRDDVPGDELNRAEGFRHLSRMLGYALEVAVEHSDHDRPIFHPHPRLAAKWGGDNPDNRYLHAAIDGSHTYRITGNRGNCYDFIFNASSCHPMEAPGTGDRRGKETLVFSERSASDFEYGPDGSLEIIASPDEQPGNWLPLSPEVGFINVRQYFWDWDTERPAEFLIERVGHEGSSPPPLDATTLAGRLDDAIGWVEHGMPYWTKWIQEQHLCLPPSTVTPLGRVAEGAKAIHYGVGRFDLEPGQAMLLESDVPEARYWHVALLNFWFETLDHANHQSCLNGHQIEVDDDGRFRVVISREDPGVANWLDTAGHPTGVVQYRWAWTKTKPDPECRVVPLGELKNVLPASTRRVSPAERSEAIRRRREHMLRRYHLF